MIYVFDDCEFDTHLYTVQRAGGATRLRPKVFQALLYLLEHRERVVSKQELAEQIWPEQFIADATLESTIRGIRRAFGDSGQAQRIIQTLPGHGYRFVARLRVPDHEEDERPAAGGDAGTSPPGEPLRPERRQLTVLACDLLEVMELSEQLEYDDFHALVTGYKSACADVMQQFDGYVTDNVSTGLLVYFGYPQAHEDDAQRAIRAGLALLEAMPPFNEEFAPVVHTTGFQIAVRLGIHTGMVVVGAKHASAAASKMLMLGEAPSTATHIQDMAAPNTVVISEETARVVRGAVVMRSLGHHMLSGVAEPVQLFRVLRVRGAGERFEARGTAALTPLVGRDAEVRLLLERWQQAKAGLGQVVLLSGEAGIGKSRLLRAVKEALVDEVHDLIELRCSAYHLHSALYPVIDLFQRMLQWEQDDTPAEHLGKLETFLTDHALPGEKLVPLLSGLLSLPCPAERYAPLRLEPQQQRQELLEALLTILLTRAAAHPVLVMVEDLHWMDPSTAELLTLLTEHVPTQRLCLLLTYRPAFQAPWPHRSYINHITLARLAHDEVEKIVTHITHGKSLPAEVMSRVLYKTDGVPLFIEECTKALLEAAPLQEGNDRYELLAPLQMLTIPTTLHDSLMARLDRLQEGKRVAQIGAVIGRQFSSALLHAVWEEDERLLEHGLARLVEAELLYQQGLPSHVTYVFKHALVQETAYQSLLKRTRQDYHRRIARVLTEAFAETVASQPELLAHHYTEAGSGEQAIPYWQRAGQLAVERSANAEAISHFTKGLDLLKTLPETPEHVQQELLIYLALGTPLLMLKGHTAPEVEHTYSRAYELAQQLGDTQQRFSAFVGLWGYYFSQSRLLTARELAEQCFTLAQNLQQPNTLQEAHQILGSTFFFLGDQVAVQEHLQQAIALYKPRQISSLVYSRGIDPGVVCLSRIGWGLWWLGYPDEALARSHEAIALAQQLAHPYSLSFALHYNAVLHVWCREMALAKELLEASIAFMQKHGFVQFLDQAITKLGWVLVEQGDTEEGMAMIQQGLESQRIHGIKLGRTTDIAILAQAYGRTKQVREGLQVLDEAFEVVHNNAEAFYEAELYRVKGELLLQLSAEALEAEVFPTHSATVAHTEEVEACFCQAMALARHQRAKSLELRAVMSLSRLWQHQGKQSVAHKTLAEIYSWFTEGFDTPDLRDAQTLLETLQLPG